VSSPTDPSATPDFLNHDRPPVPDLVVPRGVQPFHLHDKPVRGRLVRLGPLADALLTRHDGHPAVTALAGQALALTAGLASALKFRGSFSLQAKGDGPVSMLLADCTDGGALRGYARADAERLAAMLAGDESPSASALLGTGYLAFTCDQGPDMDRYQGIVAIEGDTLALCAEQYFAQSEQTPTRIRLAVGQADSGKGAHWRAGGVLIQNIAGDDARGSTEEPWRRTEALFETLGEDELIDPLLPASKLLFRLFHEDGVRVFEAKPLRAFCRCSEDRIRNVLAAFDVGEQGDMIEPDGKIHVTCEYCSKVYRLAPEDVKPA